MACRNCNSILKDLSADLDVALEDGRGCQHVGRDIILMEALSKIRRQLHASKLEHKAIGSHGVGSTNLVRFSCEPKEGNGTSFKDPEMCGSRDLQHLTITLVSILAWESDYVSHSAAKALLALWLYTMDVPSCWTLMLHILWGALKSRSTGPVGDASVSQEEPIFAATVTLHISQNLRPSISQRNWTAVALDLQVLHNILNDCKQEASFKLKIFFDVCHLYIGDILAYFTEDQSQHRNMMHKFENELALGALLRLLCSIIHSLSLQSNLNQAAYLISKCKILTLMETFMPTLSFRCLVSSDQTCISNYLCHKYQMLLFRLHEWFTEKPSLAVMCFEILKSHADDLLGALFQRQAQWTSPVLQSPFASSLLSKPDPKPSVSSPTSLVDRHTLFLIFKVVVSLKKISHHGSKGINKDSESDVPCLEEQYASQVELWLLNWLSAEINFITDVSKVEIDNIADGLALRLIKFFVDEDILMLEMLLLLLEIPILGVFSLSIDAVDKCPDGMLLSIFKPLRLFAAFLVVVQYDHSVIVDFLVSKDTSILCLQYLLRCLHIIQNTWPEFLSLSCRWSDKQSQEDRCHLLKTDWKAQIEIVTDGVGQGQCSLISGSVIDVDNIANCLSNLKLSVERLHRRRVFPYNPSALLRRLDLFLQLWKL